MELQQRSRTVGRAVILLALLLRLQLWVRVHRFFAVYR